MLREKGSSELAITYTYPLPWGRKKSEKYFEKKTKKFIKKLNKYINFKDSLMITTQFYDFKGDSVGVYFTWNPMRKAKKASYYIAFEKNKIPKILSPTYSDYMPEEAFYLDTVDRDFQRMLSNIKNGLPKTDGKFQFFIQSTSDARPNRNNSDRSYLSIKRGRVIQDQFKKYLDSFLPDSIDYEIKMIP